MRRNKRSLHICHKKYSVWALVLKAIQLWQWVDIQHVVWITTPSARPLQDKQWRLTCDFMKENKVEPTTVRSSSIRFAKQKLLYFVHHSCLSTTGFLPSSGSFRSTSTLNFQFSVFNSLKAPFLRDKKSLLSFLNRLW